MSLMMAFAIPAFVVLIVLEAVLTASRKTLGGEIRRGYELRDTAASLTMGIGNVVLALFAKGVAFALYAAVHSVALFDLPFTWWTIPILIVCEDFFYYWFHRLHHEIRFLWAAHVNHHSSTYFNLSTALRQSWTTPITGPLFWAPLALIGFDPAAILVAQSISLIYQFWIHTELIGRLGALEWVLNTPSHHRVHHGRNVVYLDRNYGGILIIWDRLFGTFEVEGEPVDFGLTKNITTFDPVRIAFHEWVAMFRDAWHAPTWRESAAILWNPPGWSSDGRSHTARELQAALRGSGG